MRLIIAGSRSLTNYKLINKAIQFTNIDINAISEVISGCAKGIDNCAILWAEYNNKKITRFPAMWKDIESDPCLIRRNKYGKYNALAGIVRNKQMGDYADALLAIWDGKSSGTKNMIEYMQSLNKIVYVYEI
jgi:hypothetical protein